MLFGRLAGVVLIAFAMAAALWSAGCGGCGKHGKRPIGASCEAGDECVSGMCLEGHCVDPAGDEDGDGVHNALEASLGSSAREADSDGDGVRDRAELAQDLGATDTDGDGKPNIVESATADADGDCIVDERDARDDQVDSDLSPMVPLACRLTGVCEFAERAMKVLCPGAPVCVYDDVPGYVATEETCDGRDENCDGTTDEGFLAGCVTEPVRPWVVLGSGLEAQSPGHWVWVEIGAPIGGAMASPRFRARLGQEPVEGAGAP